VVTRQRRQLAEGVLAVDHPAAGARQESGRDVPDALGDGGVRLGRRTGALDPLTLEVSGDFAADKRPVAGVANLDARPGNVRIRIEKCEALSVASAPRTPLDARGHDRFLVRVERGESGKGGQRLLREDVAV